MELEPITFLWKGTRGKKKYLFPILHIKAEKVDCSGQSTFSFSVIFEIMWFYHLYFFVRYITAMIEAIKQTKKITISPVNSSDWIFVLA